MEAPHRNWTGSIIHQGASPCPALATVPPVSSYLLLAGPDGQGTIVLLRMGGDETWSLACFTTSYSTLYQVGHHIGKVVHTK